MLWAYVETEVPMKTTNVVPQQSFTMNAPGAASVCLVGDFTHWRERPIPLKRSKSGVWKTVVGLPPGTYHYRFLVDGQWRDDPACKLHAPNPFGSEDDVCVVV
jgi:1,4-alpha-glucan branching enzyme